MTIYRLGVQGWTMDNPRRTTYTVRFDENGKILNPRAIATSQQYGWGKWQSSEKVPCSFGDCWWCSTAGHGGYLLVTQNRILPFNPTPDPAHTRIFKDPSRVVDRGNLFFQVFEFEEDCDWAILEYNDPKLREYSLARVNRNRANVDPLKLPLTAEEYFQRIISTMRGYSKSLLKPEDQEEVA